MIEKPAQLDGAPVAILLETNLWATRALLAAMEPLTDDQLDHEFEMGLGTLRKTVTHVLAAMRGWADLLEGNTQRERLDEPDADGNPKVFSVAEMKDHLETIAKELHAGATAGPTSEVCQGHRGDRKYAFTRGGVICHVTTHGVHHRAQCQNMLRHLGVSELPQSSVLEWMFYEAPTDEMRAFESNQ